MVKFLVIKIFWNCIFKNKYEDFLFNFAGDKIIWEELVYETLGWDWVCIISFWKIFWDSVLE